MPASTTSPASPSIQAGQQAPGVLPPLLVNVYRNECSSLEGLRSTETSLLLTALVVQLCLWLWSLFALRWSLPPPSPGPALPSGIEAAPMVKGPEASADLLSTMTCLPCNSPGILSLHLRQVLLCPKAVCLLIH